MEKLDEAESLLLTLEQKTTLFFSKLKGTLHDPYSVEEAEGDLRELLQLLDAIDARFSGLSLSGLHAFENEISAEDPQKLEESISHSLQQSSADLAELELTKKKIHEAIQLTVKELIS